jgi:hypothetical protein
MSADDPSGNSHDPVVLQLAAYNARAIEPFIACFTPDVVFEDGAGVVTMRGHQAMRERYAAMFDANPSLHCEVVSRIRVGSYVLDEEHVTGRGPGVVHVVVIYRVAGDRIEHVRVLR